VIFSVVTLEVFKERLYTTGTYKLNLHLLVITTPCITVQIVLLLWNFRLSSYKYLHSS